MPLATDTRICTCSVQQATSAASSTPEHCNVAAKPTVLKLASVADSLPETTKNEIQPKNSFIDFVLSGLNFCSLQNLEFGIDCDSRIALVGPNGAGKSTLLKLMTGDITPTKGTVNRHSHLSIGRYHQHSVDVLDNDATVLDFFSSSYPNSLTFKREMEEWRAYLGHYGITGEISCYILHTMCSSQSWSSLFIAVRFMFALLHPQ